MTRSWSEVAMLWLALVGLMALTPQVASGNPAQSNETTVILVIGAFGEEEFGSNFVRQAFAWREACTRSGATVKTVGLSPREQKDDRSLLQSLLEMESKEGDGKLWLILAGHGTFDGRTAKFNLRGPDLNEEELANWLKPFNRPVAVLNTSSASGPFLKRLTSANRVVVTATRSGREQNFARFGQYLAEAITEPANDLDKDGQVSLLEAFLNASRKVDEFYKAEARIRTEHALLDDNGDGLGTPADWFRGIHVRKRPSEDRKPDGALAAQFVLVPSPAESTLSREQRARRDDLENAVFELRNRKGQIAESEYYRQLEDILLEIARLYRD